MESKYTADDDREVDGTTEDLTDFKVRLIALLVFSNLSTDASLALVHLQNPMFTYIY